MDNLPFTQELDGVAHIRIIAQAQNIIIGYTRLLFGGEILIEIYFASKGTPDAAIG